MRPGSRWVPALNNRFQSLGRLGLLTLLREAAACLPKLFYSRECRLHALVLLRTWCWECPKEPRSSSGVKGNAGIQAHLSTQASCLNIGTKNHFRHVIFFLKAKNLSVILLTNPSEACWRKWPTPTQVSSVKTGFALPSSWWLIAALCKSGY